MAWLCCTRHVVLRCVTCCVTVRTMFFSIMSCCRVFLSDMILPYDKALLHVGHNLFFDVAFISKPI